MTAIEKRTLTTVDLTPSFEGAVSICILLLESGDASGKKAARDELRKYGRMLDALKRKQKEEQ